MALQSKVLAAAAPAIAGMPASVVETHYTALSYQAASDLAVGSFCFADGTSPDTKVNKAGSILRGFVVYTRQYVAASATPSMTVPKGAFVQLATNGKFWAVAQNASPKVGDCVLVSKTDGSIVTQTGNANKEGYVMTNFLVVKTTGTQAKSLVLISNQQPGAISPMAAAAENAK